MVLQVDNLSKSVKQGGEKKEVLAKISCRVDKNELVAVTGRSGSGKTTLLHCIAGLTTFESGEIQIGKELVRVGDDKQLSNLRLQSIGIVFQFFNLLPSLTLLQNVILPARLAGISTKVALERGQNLCEMVGVSHCAGQLPGEVSGGEAQRAAIARALVNKPVLLLADEPTGNLDDASSRIVMDLLSEMVKSTECGALMVSHDPETVSRADRVLILQAGTLRAEL
jgi:ABC-type lipoprotein export system ATPase subunit